MNTTALPTTLDRPQTLALWRFILPWVLLIPLLVFAGSGKFSVQTGLSNTVYGNAVAPAQETGGEREMLIASYLILTLVILSRYPAVLETAVDMKAMTALAALAIASAVWSQYPLISLVRGSYYFFDTLFAYYLVRRYRGDRLRELFIMLGWVVAVSSIAVVAFLPKYGIVNQASHTGAWLGIFSEKNFAGKSLVFLLTPAINFRRRLTLPAMTYCGVILALIVMSQSRTALAAAAVYIAFMFYLHKAKQFEKHFFLLSTMLVLLLAVFSGIVILGYLSDLLLLIGRDATLSGRTTIWHALLLSVTSHPLLGYGFQAFWSGLNGESRKVLLSVNWRFGYAHNGFLEILLQTGVVGLSIVGYLLLKAMKDAWFCFRYSDESGVDWYSGIIFLTLIYNFDEETLFFPHELVTLMFLVAACGLAMASKHSSRTRRSESLHSGMEAVVFSAGSAR